MKSSVKWYGKDDLIPQSSLYIHCLYVCRKAKNKMSYLTDGNIEILYDRNAHVVITIMEVKNKFKPITQYIKPEYLKQIKGEKKEKKMRKAIIKTGTCLDCERENVKLTAQGLCEKCIKRKHNAKHNKKEYIPYKDLSEKEKHMVDRMIEGHNKKKKDDIIEESPIELKIPSNENYYQAKATQTPVQTHSIKIAKETDAKKILDPLSNQSNFIQTLRDYGCEIPENNLKNILDVLITTDKLKNIFIAILNNDNQDTMLNLEQTLNVVEKKLQHNWECNGFQETDDVKFKEFLTWRRILKDAISFWKKLYQTNALTEMQKAWDVYTSDSNDKQLLTTEDKVNTVQKKYQITTESISNIFNTKRPFSRVFFAISKDDAYKKFTKWMEDHLLHENKPKTVITELSSEESIDERNE